MAPTPGLGPTPPTVQHMRQVLLWPLRLMPVAGESAQVSRHWELLAQLTDRAGMMVSPKAVQALGNEHDRKPVGAGPWKFVSWSANEKIVVTRADKYWRQDRGFVDSIEFSIIPELATGLRAGGRYFYRFRTGGMTSPTGRTRTLPTGQLDRLGIALVSCSNSIVAA